MGGIAQDFDRVLQFRFSRHLRRDDVGNDKTAAGTQDAEYFLEHAARPVEMVHREPRHHGIESRIRKWQLRGIAFAKRDVVKAGLGAAMRRLLQHLRREIERHHIAGGLRNHGAQDARTAGDIEHRLLRRLAQC